MTIDPCWEFRIWLHVICVFFQLVFKYASTARLLCLAVTLVQVHHVFCIPFGLISWIVLCTQITDKSNETVAKCW